MKIYWSAFLSLFLLILAGCGEEQFGVTPQGDKSSASALTVYEQNNCAGKTTINPKVDILYVVDNSSSNGYISQADKTKVFNTINSISPDFEYRVIGIPLLETDHGNDDFEVLTNATLEPAFANKKISSYTQFSFFNKKPKEGAVEAGMERIRSFIAAHSSDGLFRQKAYLFIVLVSNGRDNDIERLNGIGGTEKTDLYPVRLNSMTVLKQSLESAQFRFFSISARTKCHSTWYSTKHSYVAMSKDIYNLNPGLPLASEYQDNFDLCSGNITQIFSSVNESIKKITVHYTYKYWPITFASGSFDTSKIQVFKKSSPTATPVEMTLGWKYIPNPGTTNTRILPTPGEPTQVPHLIEFLDGHEITSPACVLVTSTSNLEYFAYIPISKEPKPESISVKINSREIPKSDTNGWKYIKSDLPINIKVDHNGYSSQPADLRSGPMIQLNGSDNYYKSGDNVEVNYIPASIN